MDRYARLIYDKAINTNLKERTHMICAPRSNSDSILPIKYWSEESRFELFPVVDKANSEECVIPNQRTYRILLLDDNPIFLRAIGRLLETHSFDVEIEECQRRACDILSQKGDQFDLALVDVGLQDCSGIQFAKKIEHLQHAPPVMLMSGEHHDCEAQAPANVKGFLPKPFSVSDLIRKISDMKFDAALACS